MSEGHIAPGRGQTMRFERRAAGQTTGKRSAGERSSYLERRLTRPQRLTAQIAVIVAFFAAWQFLPLIPPIADHTFISRFYISSPSEIVTWLGRLATGTDTVAVWPYLYITAIGTVVGTAIGIVAGAVVGLLFAEVRALSDIAQPFVVVLNSVPRIALIPIIVLIAGPTLTSSIINVALVVFFLAFFNAFNGGRQIKSAMVENALLLGASRWQIMLRLRSPYVLLWTFAVIPNAISFGLVVAVTNELLTGLKGMGALLLTATANLEAGLTFGVIIILAVVGVILYGLAEIVRRRATRWLN